MHNGLKYKSCLLLLLSFVRRVPNAAVAAGSLHFNQWGDAGLHIFQLNTSKRNGPVVLIENALRTNESIIVTTFWRLFTSTTNICKNPTLSTHKFKMCEKIALKQNVRTNPHFGKNTQLTKLAFPLSSWDIPYYKVHFDCARCSCYWQTGIWQILAFFCPADIVG